MFCLRSFGTAFILVLVTSCLCFASDSPLIYFILDGSGSMWGRVEGKMKIEAAKEVMADLINETPSDIQAGFMVYGHRKRNDCADIEEIIQPAPLDKKVALDRIKKITPQE